MYPEYKGLMLSNFVSIFDSPTPKVFGRPDRPIR
jgi:hypothetical protein